jgi:DNA polymerase-3 subunit epsilon
VALRRAGRHHERFAYDLTVITRELARHAISPLRIGYVVDPFVLDKQVDKYRKGKRTLTALCDVYRCRIDGAHDSAHDALAAARVAYRIAQLFPASIGRAELEELHRLQIIWFAEQAAGLEAHFRKTDPNARCSREWPVRTAS